MRRLLSISLALCLMFACATFAGAEVGGTDAEVNPGMIYTLENPAHPYIDVPGTYEPSWSSGVNSTHQFITGNAINLIKKAVSSYPLTSYTSTLKTKSDAPDSASESISKGENDAGTFLGHFYDPATGKTWDGSTAPTAKTRLVNHYQTAVSRYKAGNISAAMESLGFALHYAADLSTPHHAANITAPTQNHIEYEAWVASNQNNYVATSLSSSTFTWAKNTSVSDMGHNFAVNAKEQIGNAKIRAKFATATANALPKAQRNCAAILYKFLIDVGAVK